MSSKNNERKVIRDSETFWELEGESTLNVITIPERPVAGKVTTVRLTHSNSYGPFDEVDFYVRRGNPDRPTAEDDLDGAKDWVEATLVEELVSVDDEEMLRADAEVDPEEETPWDGTYEAQLTLPAGQHLIEIKIVSHEPELLNSRVLADWEIEVG